MFCVKCGAELYPNSKVCPSCRFDNAAVAQPPAPPATYAPYGTAYPDVYVEDRIVVVPPNAQLPASCVKCGGVPKQPWLNRNFYWHNPLLFLIVLISPLIYVIVALIVRKKRALMVPICSVHESQRKTRLWIGALMLLACIPAGVALGVSMQSDLSGLWGFLLGFALFLGGLIVISSSYVLRPTYIGTDCAKFKGAHPEFLARIKPRAFAAAATPTPPL